MRDGGGGAGWPKDAGDAWRPAEDAGDGMRRLRVGEAQAVLSCKLKAGAPAAPADVAHRERFEETKTRWEGGWRNRKKDPLQVSR